MAHSPKHLDGVGSVLSRTILEGAPRQHGADLTAGDPASGEATALVTGAAIRQAFEGKMLPAPQVQLFRNIDQIFPTRTIARGPVVYTLPRSHRPLRDLCILSNGARFDLFDYISRNRIAGLLVVKGGAVAFEHYDFGNDAGTRWVSMSIAKSISTTLVGVAVHDGFISSVDDMLTDYLPELGGTSYSGVLVRDLLQMTSGVRWDDTHTDPASDRRHMLELQIAQQPGAISRYVASRPRVAAPGTRWNYSTGETHIVGALLHAVVGRWLSDYLSERIWANFGMEADATWWLESARGLEVAGSGISATLRDYGRFGLFMMNDGVVAGRRVLPEGWVREATAPRDIGGNRQDYGYMWWPVAAGDGTYSQRAFSARGIFGQYLYVNPVEQTVIVVWSSRSKPKGAEAIVDNDFFNAVVEVLR